MNPYRVALILCRAISIDFWWSAAINLVSGIVLTLVVRSGVLGAGFPGAMSNAFYQMAGVVPSVVGAIFLQQFAPSISASVTGSGALEGDAIASRHALEPREMALAHSGAGLMLLFFGLTGALFSTAWGGYTLWSNAYGSGIGRTVAIYSMGSALLPASLHCFVGFVLAFRLGLRRLVKSQ